MTELEELFKIEREEISHFFKKASIEGKGTPQEVSDRRETAIKKFLQKYIPLPYKIGKGNIIDSYGSRSKSIDCVLLNPSHPFTTNSEGQYSILLADGVDAAIEVKPDFSNKKEIIRSLIQIQSVKKLRRVSTGVALKSKIHPDKLETYRQIPGIIFCEKTYVDINKLITEVANYYISNSIDIREQFDLIVINGRGILTNIWGNGYIEVSESNGLYFKEMSDLTLSSLLFFLNFFPQSVMRMKTPVLRHYLKDPMPGEAISNQLINKKLREI